MTKQNTINNISINTPVISTATSYTALLTDYIIEVTSTSALRTITLPAPATTGAGSTVGKQFIIKDTSGSAGSPNTITITPASGTINGVSSIKISNPYGSALVMSDGTNYFTSSITGIPANFRVYNNADTAGLTGDNTVATLRFNTVDYDRGANFNTSTNTFIAPVTGNYYFNLNLYVSGISALNTNLYCVCNVNSGSRTVVLLDINPANIFVTFASGNTCLSLGSAIGLSSGDSVIFTIVSQGAGSKNVIERGTAAGAAPSTILTGFFISS